MKAGWGGGEEWTGGFEYKEMRGDRGSPIRGARRERSSGLSLDVGELSGSGEERGASGPEVQGVKAGVFGGGGSSDLTMSDLLTLGLRIL